MKKIYYLLLLLFVVTTATSAKDVKTYNKTYKEAAVASHKTMKKNLVEGKHIPSQIKRLKNNGKSFSKPKYTYEIVFTDSAVQANKTNSKGKIKIEAQKFAFEGNLTIKDSKTNDKVKYVAKGYFTVSKDSISEKVKGQKAKRVTIVYNEGQPIFVPEKLTRVPYFDSEAQKKAKDLVEAYYKQHKEFSKVNIGKVEPCKLGYKVTTSRTFYKDEQQYTGDEGTVIFTVQKDNEQLDGFKLLDITEDALTEFDNTPMEPTLDEVVQEPESTNSFASVEDIEKIAIKGFRFKSYDLTDENKAELEKAAEILLRNPDLEIELLGHSCNVGENEAKYIIGILRAKEAKQYLVERGVDAKHIYVHSYADKRPIVPNTTAENRAQNRRVEIKIIK